MVRSRGLWVMVDELAVLAGVWRAWDWAVEGEAADHAQAAGPAWVRVHRRTEVGHRAGRSLDMLPYDLKTKWAPSRGRPSRSDQYL